MDTLPCIILVKFTKKRRRWESFQLDLTTSMAWTKSSYFAPVTSLTTCLSFRILKVGTTFIPSSFANGCQINHNERESERQFKCSCICYMNYAITFLSSSKKVGIIRRTLLSWLQSSFRKITSRYFSDNSWNLGAITLQGPHLQCSI